MKKKEIFLIILVCIFVFLIVYSPHFKNRFPLHLDEWHHITEAIKLGNGEYVFQGRQGYITQGFEIGFHSFILVLSKLFDIIFAYQYLAALFAVFSSLVLFYVVFKKTGNFLIGISSMIFFASIKSNANILGLNFFTPLTFAIPFIFLYVYFFTEGLEKQNKKYILISIFIMTFLLFFHSVSVLFSLPFLFVYSLFYLSYIKKEYKFFLWFLIIPIIGSIFYIYMEHVSVIGFLGKFLSDLQFKKGWGVYEYNNSFFEIYSLTGYILAFLGLYEIIFFGENRKKYIPYILWPFFSLISILIFRIFQVSFLSPYQRNLYYLAIGLPILSAFGLKSILRIVKDDLKKLNLTEKKEKITKKVIFIAIFCIIIFLIFFSYYKTPELVKIYHTIDESDYNAISYLSQYPNATVMAPLLMAPAIYPISGHTPVGTIWFYGDSTAVESFYSSTSCIDAEEILKKYDVKYIITRTQFKCNWTNIYSDGDYVYEWR